MARRQSGAFLRVGLPMIVLVTGGSVILSQLLQGKYDIKVLRSSCMCTWMHLGQLNSG